MQLFLHETGLGEPVVGDVVRRAEGEGKVSVIPVPTIHPPCHATLVVEECFSVSPPVLLLM